MILHEGTERQYTGWRERVEGSKKRQIRSPSELLFGEKRVVVKYHRYCLLQGWAYPVRGVPGSVLIPQRLPYGNCLSNYSNGF